MLFKKIHFFLALALAGVLAVLLVGCSESNPLRKIDYQEAAQALLSSAISAENQLGLEKHAHQPGYYYQECMAGRQTTKICNAIYKQMSQYLKEKYPGITVLNIQNRAMWSSVKSKYLAFSVAQADHCPSLSSLQLDKLGFCVAPGGWKSKTNGHRYVMPDGFHDEVSGWTEMNLIGFIHGYAERNPDTHKIELESCVYAMQLRDNTGAPVVLMYLVPKKIRYVNPNNPAWKTWDRFSYNCHQLNHRKENKPARCSFSA